MTDRRHGADDNLLDSDNDDLFAGSMPQPGAAATEAAPAPSWDTTLPQGSVPAVPEGDVTIDFVDTTTGAATAARGPVLEAATERAVPSISDRLGAQIDDALGGGVGGGPAAAAAERSKTHFWQLAHYSRLFDVDTKEVLQRMAGALVFRRDLFSEIEAKPDLYGPFWVSTTCVFLMAMISNALDWLAQRDAGVAFKGDLEKIAIGAAVMYGYVFGAGVVLWLWLKVVSLAAISLSALWCIYGYSMTIWIPVTLLAMVPSSTFLWCLALGASLYSGVFLTLNLKPPVQESLVPSRQAMTLLLVFLAHQMVAVALRTLVLTYTIEMPAQT